MTEYRVISKKIDCNKDTWRAVLEVTEDGNSRKVEAIINLKTDEVTLPGKQTFKLNDKAADAFDGLRKLLKTEGNASCIDQPSFIQPTRREKFLLSAKKPASLLEFPGGLAVGGFLCTGLPALAIADVFRQPGINDAEGLQPVGTGLMIGGCWLKTVTYVDGVSQLNNKWVAGLSIVYALTGVAAAGASVRDTGGGFRDSSAFVYSVNTGTDILAQLGYKYLGRWSTLGLLGTGAVKIILANTVLASHSVPEDQRAGVLGSGMMAPYSRGGYSKLGPLLQGSGISDILAVPALIGLAYLRDRVGRSASPFPNIVFTPLPEGGILGVRGVIP